MELSPLMAGGADALHIVYHKSHESRSEVSAHFQFLIERERDATTLLFQISVESTPTLGDEPTSRNMEDNQFMFLYSA